MLPDVESFKYQMEKLDIRKEDTIVCYDSANMLAAPRASWMMRIFGAKNVLVLDGTFKKWSANGYDVSSWDDDQTMAFTRKGSRSTEPTPDSYNFELDESMLEKYDQIKQKLSETDPIILDSRYEEAYFMGHIKEATNVPFVNVLNLDNTFKSADEIN